MNIMLVIVALLFNLLSGGTTSNVPTTIVPDGTAWSNPNYLVQLMYMYGGNVDMNRAYEQEYDKTYYFEDGYQAYGWGKGSSVRVHGNMNSGVSTLILISKWIITSKKSLSTLLWKV